MVSVLLGTKLFRVQNLSIGIKVFTLYIAFLNEKKKCCETYSTNGNKEIITSSFLLNFREFLLKF